MIHLTGLYKLILNKYEGSTLTEEMLEKLNDVLYDDMQGEFKFNVEHKYVENQRKSKLLI